MKNKNWIHTSTAIALVMTSAFLIAGQQGPRFDQSVTESENRWVILPSVSGENKYLFGYIYIDGEAGFTLHVGGWLTNKENDFIRVEDGQIDKTAYFKMRIEQNMPVGHLSSGQITALGLPERPDWLDSYDDGTDTVSRRIRRGRWYNNLGDTEKAVILLESAYSEEPGAEGLAFELGYAYNALNRSEQAIPVLKAGLAKEPKNPFLGSELAYAFLFSGDTKNAIDTYLHFIKIGPDRTINKSEMAYNLAQAYKKAGDTKKHDRWIAKAKKWAPKGSPLSLYFAQSKEP